jgi:hypothetical protein
LLACASRSAMVVVLVILSSSAGVIAAGVAMSVVHTWAKMCVEELKVSGAR